MGADCQLGQEPAENMQSLSRILRTTLAEAQSSPSGANALRSKINSIYAKIDFNKEAAIPCLMQMLQPENTPIRQVLLNQLAGIKHRRSSEALVKVALFDLNEDLRGDAVQELASRPPEDYRHLILEGFRYPWAPVAQHAAEALVALKDMESVPALKRLAEDPNPVAPYFDATSRAYQVREVVRINHLQNCLMCHAPSKSTIDMVRGRVPSPNQPLPPLTQYYEDTQGTFVRADVTYLRQDFSVPQPVDKPGQWPSRQRYDYLVRTRQAGYNDLPSNYPQQKPKAAGNPFREAVLFALKELGG